MFRKFRANDALPSREQYLEIMRLSLICATTILFCSAIYAETTSFTCQFPLAATPEGIAKQSPPLEMRFISDPATKKSYLIGNIGSSEVQMIENHFGKSLGVTFVEVTGTGNVMVTAITSSGEAVHSRNVIFSDKLIPFQSYGKCERQ